MKAEQAELAALTPAQLAAREHRLATEMPARAPEKPDFWNLAVEAVQAEDEAPEREQREQRERDWETALAKWDAAKAQIDERERAAIREAHEQRTKSEQAARERAQAALDDLGPRPAMNDHEVTICTTA